MASDRYSQPGSASRIAVVGAAGRFPGADNLQQYWTLLLEGGVSVAEPERSRTELWRALEDPELGPKITTIKGGYLRDVAGFDADFFSISPREAVKLDPQQRLLMEVVHDALEDAAITRAELQELNVGVFVGAGSNDYMNLGAASRQSIDGYHGIGNSHSLLANRLSYYYNLKGPSLTIDTACSSSLTALHFAVQSLQYSDLDMAIVGGVNVIVSPDLTLAFSQAKMLSPSGRCKTFGADADGYGRAEGVGAVILRRLPDAERLGHGVRCVIRASAVNQDGRSNGITAPNGLSQVQVIQSAMARAGVSPAEMAYMETHGTGTTLGDAIEFSSLRSVFSGHPETRCFVGSVKANIGHAEAAAGICGLLKAMLMLEHDIIPPHPVKAPYNKLVAQAGDALGICEAPRPMEPGRRCIGVSSFGFGGSNAHVIVEGYDTTPPAEAEAGRAVLVPLSSHDAGALAADARSLAAVLTEGGPGLADVAATLSLGRDHLRQRAAVVARDPAELMRLLDGLPAPTAVTAEVPKVAFVFTGQGSQHAGMGRELYERLPAFREAFEHCASLVAGRSGLRMEALLYGPAADDDRLLDDTHCGQLSLFCFEYALACTWMALGVMPDFAIGHSLGELSAHAVSGTLSLEDAVALVNERARLMQAETRAGAMLALATEPETAVALLQELALPLYLAAINGRRSVVVSGEPRAVAKLRKVAEGRNLTSRLLRTRHAFHSPHFAAAAERLQSFAASLEPMVGRIPLASNLDGRLLHAVPAGPAYWSDHIVRPVRFADGIQALVAQGATVFIEIGPDRVLSQYIARDHGAAGVIALSSLSRGRDSEFTLLQAVAGVYRLGVDIAFGELAGTAARRLRLPARSLCRSSYWSTPSPTAQEVAKAAFASLDLPMAPDHKPAKRPQASLQGVIDRQLQVMRSQLNLLNGR